MHVFKTPVLRTFLGLHVQEYVPFSFTCRLIITASSMDSILALCYSDECFPIYFIVWSQINIIKLTWWWSFRWWGLVFRESELDRARNRFMKLSCGPEVCRALPLWVGTANCVSKICPIGVAGDVTRWFCSPGGIPPPVGPFCNESLNCDSSIDWSIFICWICFLLGRFTPDKSDFDLGLNASAKKFFTFEDVDDDSILAELSPDCLRCRDFPENNPRRPVDPERGRKSPSGTSFAFVASRKSGSISGIAKAPKSWKYNCIHYTRMHIVYDWSLLPIFLYNLFGLEIVLTIGCLRKAA